MPKRCAAARASVRSMQRPVDTECTCAVGAVGAAADADLGAADEMVSRKAPLSSQSASGNRSEKRKEGGSGLRDKGATWGSGRNMQNGNRYKQTNLSS